MKPAKNSAVLAAGSVMILEHSGRSFLNPTPAVPTSWAQEELTLLGKPTEPMPSSQQDRYDRVAISLHWIVGAAVLAQLAFGWTLDELKRGTPTRAFATNLHKSTGLLLALLILARLFWRLRHRPPAYPMGMDARQLRAAKFGHVLLYACMIGMPVSGYLASNFSKHGIRFLNQVQLPPWGPDDKVIYGLLNGTHDVLAYVFSGLVVGHILFALYHGLVLRDGVLSRMWVRTRKV
jgi:cytochrome b561